VFQRLYWKKLAKYQPVLPCWLNNKLARCSLIGQVISTKWPTTETVGQNIPPNHLSSSW